jgi:hypothetical protein
MGGLLEMSDKELDRYTILKKVLDHELTQKHAAQLLKITDRQVRNLLKCLIAQGPNGIVSKRRGKPSNHCLDINLKQRTIALMREYYEDFGPTFAKEKLYEYQGINVSVETLRTWMIESRLWVPRHSRKKMHRPRRRRECFGELTQADGSEHHWFGDELPSVNATVLVDDATGMLVGLFFSQTETLEGYFSALEQHIVRWGIPRALYTDRYAVFQTTRGNGRTQMQRALGELGVELILANSPQAKGRVERTNRTLQDRLLKEMRLRGIKTIEAANAYAEEFVNAYNAKFSKKPMSRVDAHRPLGERDLQKILSHCETRTLLSGLIFQYKNKFFVVQNIPNVRRAEGRKIEIRTNRNGQMRVFMDSKELEVREWGQMEHSSQIMTRKEVLNWKPRGVKIQPETHPWKKWVEKRVKMSIKGRDSAFY